MKLTKKNVVATVMSALMVLGTSMFVSCDNGSTDDEPAAEKPAEETEPEVKD